MSSFIPRRLVRKCGRAVERALPPRVLDWLSQFWAQTRILFSRSLIMMLVAMFALFTWATIKQETFKENIVFGYLLVQSIALGILLHMSLWEMEREGRTFELLIMRVPGVHRLIWFKMRVSLMWNLLLLLPFFAGFLWFVTIPLWRGLIYLVFCLMAGVFTALLTCIVASFAKGGLPTAVIVAVILWMQAMVSFEGRLPYGEYYNIFIFPMTERYWENWSRARVIIMLLVNRLFLLAMAGLLYWWLFRRIQKTERWIG